MNVNESFNPICFCEYQTQFGPDNKSLDKAKFTLRKAVDYNFQLHPIKTRMRTDGQQNNVHP